MNILTGLLAASTLLGAFFVAVAMPVVPPWLFTVLMIGFAGFIAATVLAFLGKKIGYWIGLILAILVLAVALPAPAHLLFITSGRITESAIFIVGSVLQIIYITAFIQNILRRKRLSPQL